MFLLVVVTIAMLVIYLGGFVILFLQPELQRRWRRLMTQTWAQTLLSIINVRVAVANDAPQGEFLLVCNHLSYLDILVLQAQLDCAFVAKSEIASWPLIGLIVRSVQTIFIDRRVGRHIQRALVEIQQTNRRGLGVVLFAEGTSTNGKTVSRFKSSLLEIAAREQTPVQYASISYSVEAGERGAEESVCWWGDMTFVDHLFRMLQLPSIGASVIYGIAPIVDSDRHLLASKLWTAVTDQFQPVV